MDTNPHTEAALNKFGKYLVTQARANLTRMNKRVTNRLYESLDYDVKVMANSFSMDFLMEEYGEWVDKGRKAGKAPPFSAIHEWVQNRRIQFRDNKGMFQSYEQTAWAVVGGIKKNGIEASNFYTRPFNLGYAKLPAEVAEAYALDVESFLEYTIDKLNEKYKDGNN